MAKFNKPKEGIDYAKVDELTKEIAEKVNEIRELYLKKNPQGDYLIIEIGKNDISVCNTFDGDDIDFPIDYSEHFY